MTNKHYLVNVSDWNGTRLKTWFLNVPISLLPRIFIESQINPQTKLNEVWICREDE